MVAIQNLTVEFGANPLFDNINFVINRRDKIALVGKNGAGKSTMLKIIAGLQLPSSGKVAVQNGISIGYLPQQMEVSDTLTVMDETRKAFAHIDQLKNELKSVSDEVAERSDYESMEYQELVDRLALLSERVAMEESESGDAEIERTLAGLGFLRSDFSRMTSEFSGGWRMRIELAKILLQRPDLLLLDEPTNHLDIESIQWLEQFLATKAGAVVMVSHDRAFIDNVTTRTIEISLGRIYDYSVNYSKFVELRKERIEQQKRAFNNQQKQIQETEDFIERFRYKATKSVQVQSRIKQLSKIERIEVDEVDTSRLNLRFPPAMRSGDFPVIADGVGKSYGDHKVFDGVEMSIRRGEKVAFVGKNGEGKSTFVKCIMGEIPFTGHLKIGHNVQIGYFAQNQAQLLDGEITVFDTIDRVAMGDIRTKIRDILGAFMFGGEASDKFVKVLSGGEKTRLAMIKLLLEPVNLLILDEPTNHLDLPTKDILKQAIRDFDGTVIVVSHDREFLDGLVDKVYEFGGGKVRECLGGIYEFLDRKRTESLSALQQSTRQMPMASESKNIKGTENPSAKNNYMAMKEREKIIRNARKKVGECEDAIAIIEADIASVEEQLASGCSSTDVFVRHGQLKASLDRTMEEWETAAAELEALEKNS